MSQGKNAVRAASNSVNRAASKNQSTQKGGKKSNSFFQGCLGCLGIIILISIAIIALSIIFSILDDTSNNQEQVVAGNSQQVDNLQSQVRQAIVSTTGKTANTGEQKIIDLQVNDNYGTVEEGDKVIVAYLHADENLKPSMTKGGIELESTEILKKLFSIEKVEEVTLIWQMPLVDTLGKTTTETVIKIMMNKNVAKTVNWENFDRKNISKIASDYWVHPVLKNSK